MDKKESVPKERRRLSLKVKTQVLTEAGYRCAVPTCRTILALDMHHIYHVSESGKDEVPNLIALCPNCHRLYHRGEIARDAIYAWKGMLVALSQAFDVQAVDQLLFLSDIGHRQPIPRLENAHLVVSGDGVLQFSRLIGAGLADFAFKFRDMGNVLYEMRLTDKGSLVVEAWKSGNREAVERALRGIQDNRGVEE